MSDWTAGYVADIGYTYGYYPELNPHRAALPFINSGLVLPEFGTACELGFGQGVSVNVNASASSQQWWGTDFNPEQASFAREMSAAGNNGAQLFDQGFDEFCTRSDLPEFDFIGLHGIWSWISDENRAVIVDFVRRKLKVGGVLYVSYNTQPGWAAMVPVRHLMTEHAHMMGNSGQGMLARVEGALEFTDKMLALNPAFARANPQVKERFKKLKDQARPYLAHEYFNRDWHPMPFSRMAEWLAPAKVGFACSAHYLDHVDAANLTDEQQAFIKNIPDPQFRETVRDYMVNQQFRRDYWVKGLRKLSPLQQVSNLRRQRVLLAAHPADVSLKLAAPVGEVSLQEAIYGPLLELLSDLKPREVGQLESALQEKGINQAKMIQALMVLSSRGDLVTLQDEKAQAKARPRCDKLNQWLLERARDNPEVGYLASPMTGGGINVPRSHQLFLLARAAGAKTAEDMAAAAWKLIASQGQRLVKDGKPLESAEANLAELTGQARDFVSKRLAPLKALGVAA